MRKSVAKNVSLKPAPRPELVSGSATRQPLLIAWNACSKAQTAPFAAGGKLSSAGQQDPRPTAGKLENKTRTPHLYTNLRSFRNVLKRSGFFKSSCKLKN